MVWWVEAYSNCSMGLDMARDSLDEHDGPPQPTRGPNWSGSADKLCPSHTPNSLIAPGGSIRLILPSRMPEYRILMLCRDQFVQPRGSS